MKRDSRGTDLPTDLLLFQTSFTVTRFRCTAKRILFHKWCSRRRGRKHRRRSGAAAAMKGDFAGALFLGLCANVAMINTNIVPTQRAGKREKRAAAQETWVGKLKAEF